MTQKLSQVLAVERSAKSKAHAEITNLHRLTTKGTLFSGFSKDYKPLDEDGETFPPEKMRVQLNAESSLKDVERVLTDLFDLTATKDSANQSATADVVVDGETLLKNVPATTLLFLEKQLNDIKTFVGKMPTLETAYEWAYDEAVDLYKTDPIKTTKTKKVAKPIVLYPATDKHPAQTQLMMEDQIVGHWTRISHSAALPPTRKTAILEKIEKLARAVKFAREEANTEEAPRREVGTRLFRYIFSK